MAYKQLGSMEGYSGERIYLVGYCKCKQKVFLCESEFNELLDFVGWDIRKYTLRDFLQKRYKFRIPKITIE